MLVLALIAAAAMAGEPAKQSKPPKPMVQLTKTLCKASRTSTDAIAPTCRAAESRIAGPVNCFCEGGYVQVDVPACWRDGTPAMKPRGYHPSTREFDQLVACEQVSADQAHSK